MGKFGDVFFEADDNSFTLRALNDSKSAFSAFAFDRGTFFDEYACGLPDGSPVSCKLMIKPIQHVLRGLKRVLSLRIYLNDAAREGEEEDERGDTQGSGWEREATAPRGEPRIIFDMQCEWGMLKRHHFQLQDCEIVHAVFQREGASCLAAQANHLTQLLDHFHGSYEVAFLASPHEVFLKTYRAEEGEKGVGGGGAGGGVGGQEQPGHAVLSTEMTVSAQDVDGYEFAYQGGAEEEEEEEEDPQVGLVFSVREVKAFLSFCEATECTPVTFYYHDGGRPVLFVFEGGEGLLSVELVLATVEPSVTALHHGGGAASSSARPGTGGGVKKEKVRGGGRGGGGGGGGGARAEQGQQHEEEEQQYAPASTGGGGYQQQQQQQRRPGSAAAASQMTTNSAMQAAGVLAGLHAGGGGGGGGGGGQAMTTQDMERQVGDMGLEAEEE